MSTRRGHGLPIARLARATAFLFPAPVQTNAPAPSLFAYGTLQDSRLRRIVLGRELPVSAVSPAWLRHYRLHRVRTSEYPLIAALRGAKVGGVLISGLDRRDFSRLDFFEGDEYRRGTVRVALADGREVQAEVYLPRIGLPRDARPWRFQHWRLTERAGMLKRAQTIMSYYRARNAAMALDLT